MAADILILRSNLVPVGKDQVQHLEMTQDMAGKFNRAFGEKIFPIPKWRLDKESKVPGTDGQKMSKSYGNTIEIFAEGESLEKVVMNIETHRTPAGQPLDSDADNVFALYCLFASDAERSEMAEMYRGGKIDIGEAKKALMAEVEEYFAPFRAKRKRLAADLATVDDVLQAGAKKARAEAEVTMDLVRKATGLRA